MSAHFKLEFYLRLCSLAILIHTQKQSQMQDSKVRQIRVKSKLSFLSLRLIQKIIRAPSKILSMLLVQKNFICATGSKFLSVRLIQNCWVETINNEKLQCLQLVTLVRNGGINVDNSPAKLQIYLTIKLYSSLNLYSCLCVTLLFSMLVFWQFLNCWCKIFSADLSPDYSRSEVQFHLFQNIQKFMREIWHRRRHSRFHIFGKWSVYN